FEPEHRPEPRQFVDEPQEIETLHARGGAGLRHRVDGSSVVCGHAGRAGIVMVAHARALRDAIRYLVRISLSLRVSRRRYSSAPCWITRSRPPASRVRLSTRGSRACGRVGAGADAD